MLDVEHTELAAEQDGLEDFLRVCVPSTPPNSPPPPLVREVDSPNRPRQSATGRLRRHGAGRRHYESVYDESLVEIALPSSGQTTRAFPLRRTSVSPPLNARWWPRLSKQSTNGSRWTALSTSNRIERTTQQLTGDHRDTRQHSRA